MPRFPALSQLALALLLCLAPTISAQQPAPNPPAAETVATVADPGIDPDILALQLDPMTQDEIRAEIDAWMKILKAKAVEVAQAEIDLRSASEETKPGIQARLSALRKEKDALLKRFNVTLDAYEVKGGDPKTDRAYAAAVAGIKSDPKDVQSFYNDTREWLTSEDGGIHWLFAILQFVGIMVVFWILAKVIAKLTERALEKSSHLTGLLRKFIQTWTRRMILIVGLIVALGTIGVNVGAALALIGGGAFILGFALQDSLSNLAAGLMLMFNRPFDVGDAVEIAGVLGKVDSVSLVNTTILTFDNRKTIVPNKQVWGQVITNITGMTTRRVDMTFGIGYDDDMDLAEEIIRRVVSEHPLVLKDPEPNIKLRELADSSVNFICWPWSKTSDYLTVLSDVTKRVKVEFDKAGISIPFPQRDVHVYQEVPPPAETTKPPTPEG
ncbi:mechanosensitive ion channel family protein [Haloferula sargassicola]|uniref:Small-conductance mechanosensitive channel n=1 Tax=Haloferula sargassicola TaxID=490096 RepID=A0ABP9US18_9BACT